ncbi:MAG: TonB-dependent receptor [Pseudomonadota bacterium]|nr:TonB-dependent receptor [Pseudomonadota bacterium]
MPDLPLDLQSTIVVTASRAEEAAGASPASVTLIDAARIERLGTSLVSDLLRLIPSAAVSRSGPAGSLTDVRIRGAEANHTLLFVEGIRANDPAAGNIPRFALLNADLASRVEVVRGPQSALWGSEAIGGVVAVSGGAPGSGGSGALVEGGSLGTWRGAGRTAIGNAERGLSVGLAAQGSDGIDSFSGEGDRDGYRNLSARVAGAWRLSPALLVGGSGFALRGRNQFDGFDPVTFLRADTLDRSRNRLAAGRLFATLGDRKASYAIASASLLGSANRNFVGDDPVNRTDATRRTVTLEAGHRIGRHTLIAAGEAEHETFEARDTAFGGFTDQDRSRRHQSLTFEWKMAGLGPISTDLALRHDVFSKFKDATTVRAALLAELGRGFQVSATFGQGIAQPTFFDLFGFFPGSFVGNAALRPESSRGGEVSLRYRLRALSAGLTYYRQRLRHEIVDVFDSTTFLSTTANADGRSRRQGVEAEASWAASEALRLSATYAWLDASEPSVAAGQIKEQRRPRHSGSIAVDGAVGPLIYGSAIAYTGARIDSDFDVFPAERARLSQYWLANARLAYTLTNSVEVSARIANAFGADYQDIVGYRTEGRGIHAGLRFAFGR